MFSVLVRRDLSLGDTSEGGIKGVGSNLIRGLLGCIIKFNSMNIFITNYPTYNH